MAISAASELCKSKATSDAPDTNLLYNSLADKLRWTNLLANLLGSGKTRAQHLDMS
jgi:hypothetical protein